MDRERTEKLVQLYVDEKVKLLHEFPIEQVADLVEMVRETYQNRGTIYACGNGGNASYVGNLLTDLAMHPFVSDSKDVAMPHNIPRLKIYNLVSSPDMVTGIMNDLGPDYIFSQQLINNGVKEYDLVFGFTGSGNSKNVIEAFNEAKKHLAKTVAITRGTGGKAKDLADLCIVIPGTSTFPGQVGGNDNNFHYEDATSSISHIVVGILRDDITGMYPQAKSGDESE